MPLKKLILPIIFIFCALPSFSFDKNIVLNGKTFELKFSDCNTESVECVNEYYPVKKTNENEIITVVYAKQEKDYHRFAEYIRSCVSYSNIFSDRKGYDLVTLYSPYRYENKLYVEQKIAKVTSSPTGQGSVSFQYSIKHSVDADNKSVSRERLAETSRKTVSEMNKTKIPDIYSSSFTKI